MAWWYQNKVGRPLEFDWNGETYRIPGGRSRVTAKAGALPEDVAQQAKVNFGRLGLTVDDEPEEVQVSEVGEPEEIKLPATVNVFQKTPKKRKRR